jgi:hypothetical protein
LIVIAAISHLGSGLGSTACATTNAIASEIALGVPLVHAALAGRSLTSTIHNGRFSTHSLAVATLGHDSTLSLATDERREHVRGILRDLSDEFGTTFGGDAERLAIGGPRRHAGTASRARGSVRSAADGSAGLGDGG